MICKTPSVAFMNAIAQATPNSKSTSPCAAPPFPPQHNQSDTPSTSWSGFPQHTTYLSFGTEKDTLNEFFLYMHSVLPCPASSRSGYASSEVQSPPIPTTYYLRPNWWCKGLFFLLQPVWYSRVLLPCRCLHSSAINADTIPRTPSGRS